MTSYAFRGFLHDVRQELFDRFFCILFWRRRLRRSLEYTRNAVGQGLLEWGVVTDYTPISLKKVDAAIMGSLQELSEKESVRLTRNQTWGYFEGLGSYLGEVIIRNMAGEWVFPSRRLLWRARLSRDLSLFYDQWYVNLNGNLIPVIKIARLRQDGSGRVRSLAEVYEQIATKGSWSEMPVHSSEYSKER